MVQLEVSDELASSLIRRAVRSRCTTEDLLQALLSRLDADEAFVDLISTPALGRRIAADLKDVGERGFTTSGEVEEKFQALFRSKQVR